MQCLGIQAHTGAPTTATIKDGLPTFAHHGHRGFPHFRTPHGLDSHIGAALTISKGSHGLDLVWDVGIVDNGIRPELLG
jgi:hypothetical protein